MVLQLTIEVKSYLYKYLAARYPTDPFVLTEKTRYGIYLINCLRFRDTIRSDHRYSLQGNKHPMKVEIKEHYIRSFGIFISTRQMYMFNSAVLDEFRDKLKDFVAMRYQGRKGDIKRALHDFCEKYYITEDDLPFRSLEKMCERERRRATDWLSV